MQTWKHYAIVHETLNIYLISLIMCICGAGYVHLSAGASEDLRCQIPRNGAKYGCDPLHMGAGNQTGVHRKNNVYS